MKRDEVDSDSNLDVPRNADRMNGEGKDVKTSRETKWGEREKENNTRSPLKVEPKENSSDEREVFDQIKSDSNRENTHYDAPRADRDRDPVGDSDKGPNDGTKKDSPEAPHFREKAPVEKAPDNPASDAPEKRAEPARENGDWKSENAQDEHQHSGPTPRDYTAGKQSGKDERNPPP